jgi:branched-chain amino acid transport system permease protein
MILQFIVNGFITGLLYALVAIAFGFTYNTTRIFHIAYAGVLVAGSYIFLFFSRIGIPFVIAAPLTLLACGFLNLLIEKTIYLPMEKRRNSLNTIMVASIGLFTVLINLVAMIFGNENQTLTNEISRSFSFGNIIVTRMQMWQLVIASACIGFILIILSKSRWGLNIKALSNNRELFSVLGNDAIRVRSVLTFVSGVIAAIVSLLLAYDVGFDPYFGMPLLLNALVVMILGGTGSFYGSLLGGILLGVIQSLSVYFFEARWETAISFVILILMLIFRPQGLFGEKQRAV